MVSITIFELSIREMFGDSSGASFLIGEISLTTHNFFLLILKH